MINKELTLNQVIALQNRSGCSSVMNWPPGGGCYTYSLSGEMDVGMLALPKALGFPFKQIKLYWTCQHHNPLLATENRSEPIFTPNVEQSWQRQQSPQASGLVEGFISDFHTFRDRLQAYVAHLDRRSVFRASQISKVVSIVSLFSANFALRWASPLYAAFLLIW